jgi:hypothetical protein
MAGALTISTLNDSSGVLATQNGMSGIAKAWVNFNGTGTVAIRGSYNVSSITDRGTGQYTVNFTTAMPNANYMAAVVQRNNSLTAGIGAQSAQTASSISIVYFSATAGAFIDRDCCGVAIFSS